jgi:glycosyltransferase involved in cell wall biosynthesis
MLSNRNVQVVLRKYKQKRSNYTRLQVLLWLLFKYKSGPFKAIANSEHSVLYDDLSVLDNASDLVSTNIDGAGKVFDSSFNSQGQGASNTHEQSPSKVLWVVPDWLNVWGGGHYTIFRFANYFALNNWDSHLLIYDNSRHSNGLALERELNSAVPNCRLKVFTSEGSLPDCEYNAVVATTWQSAYWVKSFGRCSNKFYLMQDFESIFYPGGTSYLQAEHTYSFGFYGITGGDWLKSIYQSYGSTAMSYLFAVDHEIFYPIARDENEASLTLKPIKKIFFYARPSTERRCFELGVAALRLIAEKYPEIEILIAGLDDIGSLPFKAQKLGNLPIHKTADLYRECDLGIALSGSNLSYLPLELMACGCPVISNQGPQVEWFLKHMENAYLVPPVPSAFLHAFEELQSNTTLRSNMIERGLKDIADNTWELQSNRILDYINEKSS